jgi:hypothetical protein
MKLLQIDSSHFGEGSASRQLTRALWSNASRESIPVSR